MKTHAALLTVDKGLSADAQHHAKLHNHYHAEYEKHHKLFQSAVSGSAAEKMHKAQTLRNRDLMNHHASLYREAIVNPNKQIKRVGKYKSPKLSHSWPVQRVRSMPLISSVKDEVIAKVFSSSKYDWYTWKSVKNVIILDAKRKHQLVLKRGVVFGLRPATSNKNKLRLVSPDFGITIVFSIPVEKGETLIKSATPTSRPNLTKSSINETERALISLAGKKDVPKHPFGLKHIKTNPDGKHVYEGKLPDEKFKEMHKHLISKGLEHSQVPGKHTSEGYTGYHQYANNDLSELVKAKPVRGSGLGSVDWEVRHIHTPKEKGK